MIVELINTGTELMLGRVLNTHQQWLCRKLADLGCTVTRQVAIPDTGPDIQGAVRESLGRADLVITTGGLGPTSDDITRDLIAQLLSRSLVEDAGVLAHIQAFFNARKRPLPDRTRVQALVPEGAIVLHNANGTAPGLALELNPNPFRDPAVPAWLIMLPGPPRELRPMFISQVVPLLGKIMPPTLGFVCRTLRTSGLPESLVEDRISAALQPWVLAGLELGYCARPGQVDVRLAGRGSAATQIVAKAEEIVRERLGDRVYGLDNEDLEQKVVAELASRKQTLALAESCTGGLVAHRVTNVPGASAVLLAGMVTYSNTAKEQLLGVPPEVLAEHGAVSEPVARQMAEGVRRRTGADFALGITGIAGPSGGTPEKPVGTVFIALAGDFPTHVVRNMNPFDRETFKQVTSQQALEMLRAKLLQLFRGQGAG